MSSDPEYGEGWPVMPDDWESDTSFDLGWIANLYDVANNSLGKLYGDYSEFSLNEDDLLGFELDTETFTQNSGPIIYLGNEKIRVQNSIL